MAQPEPRDTQDLACFVIGPIGDRDASANSTERRVYEEAIEILENVIEPACAAYGIRVQRADQIARPGEIPEQIFRSLHGSHVVIADLTGGNPNVMYELGLRHTTGKLTIQIGERGRLPFDVSVIRTILFKRSEGGLVDARRRLSTAIGEGLQSGGDPVTATRVWFENSLPTLSSALQLTGTSVDEAEGEPGFLEKMADMSEGLDSTTVTLGAITTVINEITLLLNDSTDQVNEVDPTGAMPAARVKIANRLADRLTDPASRLEVLVGEYRQSLDRISPGIQYALSVACAEPQNESAAGFRDQVAQMLTMAGESFPIVRQYRDAALRGGEATRTLRRVNKRIAASLDRYLEAEDIFRKWQDLL